MKENVPKILLQNAFEAFRNNPDCKEDCERKATAYIFRHTAASALEGCGLKEGEIFRAMGHKMEDSDYHNEDFSNPDVFCSFSRKTDLRPITMLFNGDPPSIVNYEGETLSHVLYARQEIRYTGSQPVTALVCIQASEPGCNMDLIAKDGVHITQKLSFKVGLEAFPSPGSIDDKLYSVADALKELPQFEAVPAYLRLPEVKGNPRFAEELSRWQEKHKTSVPAVPAAQHTTAASEPSVEVTEDIGRVPPYETASLPVVRAATPAKELCVKSTIRLYAFTDHFRCLSFPSTHTIKDRAKIGKPQELQLNKNEKLIGILRRT